MCMFAQPIIKLDSARALGLHVTKHPCKVLLVKLWTADAACIHLSFLTRSSGAGGAKQSW